MVHVTNIKQEGSNLTVEPLGVDSNMVVGLDL